LDLQMNIHHFR